VRKNKKIIVINLGWEQEPLLDKISEDGYEIYGIHYTEDYYKVPKYKDVLITSLRDLIKILKYAEKIKPDAVISDQCDYSYFAQSIIAERLNLSGPRIKEAQIATNKYLQRVKAKEEGINVPEFRLCTSIDNVYEFIREFGLPVITKPVDNRGSFGVNKIKNESDIDHAFYDAVVNSHSRVILVERFIEGMHVTVDGYVFKKQGATSLGVATKKKFDDKGGIIDSEIIYPGDLSSKLYKECMLFAEEVAKVCGFDFGFTHGEFIVTEDEEIYLTEVANRGGGVYTSEVILPNFTGMDIVKIYLNDVLGEPLEVDLEKLSQKPTIMKFFSFANLKNGIVKNIKGIDRLQQNPNVLKLKLMLRKGNHIKQIKSGPDRHGTIIVTSRKKEELYAKLDEAISSLKVEVE